MKKKILLIMTCFSSLIMCIGPWTIFRVCGSIEKTMKCTFTSRVTTGLSIIMMINILVMLLKKDNFKDNLLHVNNIMMSVLTILLTTVLIGGCSVVTMPCRRVTFPMINFIAY